MRKCFKSSDFHLNIKQLNALINNRLLTKSNVYNPVNISCTLAIDVSSFRNFFNILG